MNAFIERTPYAIRILIVAVVLLLVGSVSTVIGRSGSTAEASPDSSGVTYGESDLDRCINEYARLMDVVGTNPYSRDAGMRDLMMEIGTSDSRFRTVLELSTMFQAKSIQIGEVRARDHMLGVVTNVCTKEIVSEYGMTVDKDGYIVPTSTTIPRTTTTVLRTITTVPRTTPAAPLRDCMNPSTGRITPTRGECPSGSYEPDDTLTCVPINGGPGKQVEVDFGKPCPKGYEMLGDY